MFKYQKVFNEVSFRHIVESQETVLVKHLQELNIDLNAGILFLGVRDGKTASTIITIREQKRVNNLTYNLEGSPCEQVLNDGVCCFPKDTAKLFPDDKTLLDLKVEGYIGSSIKNEAGDPIGILVALFFKPKSELPIKLKIFDIFSNFICTYIQKCHLDYQTNSHLSLFKEVEVISKTGAWEYHIETKQVFWTDEVYSICQFSKDSKLTTKQVKCFFAEHERKRVNEVVKSVLTNGKCFEEDFEFVDAKGIEKWLKVTCKPLMNDKGRITSVYGAFEDITKEKSLLLQESERSQKLDNILNNINEAVITICRSGVIQHVNQAALSIFQYSANELIGQDISKLMPEPYAFQHHHYMQSYENTGVPKIIGVGRQLTAKRKNGDIFQIELAITQSFSLGEVQYIGVIRDISERILAQDTIYNIAYTDKLTQLKNNQWFEKECKDLLLLASIKSQCIYALMLNIDKMSQFNLQFGFEQGDRVLKQIAVNLGIAIGNDFNIYRYGGDSFVILYNKVFTKDDFLKLNLNFIKTTLLDPQNYILNVGDNDIVLTASLGAATFEPDRQSYESINHILGHALRSAKKHAPFGFHHILEEGVEEFDRFVQLHKLLKSITESEELSLAFQPQYTNTGEINSFETLIRWNSSVYGWVSPAEFIPLAEETDAIIKIGDWVLANACMAIQELMHLGLQTSVSVNISAKQIVAANFSDKLIDLVTEMKISANMLVLELTETALIVDIALVKQVMNEISKHGFRFSIDDFGTGYSSLAYLKELPISELKIDKYFIDDIEDSENDYVIVDAIIDMAHALGVNSVAEGVETKEQYEYLKRKNCNIYQGYYFSKPVDIQTWREMIAIESNSHENRPDFS
ncbi:bifunctional diguanylate cyclase/phosphodiesterase [Shewanella holmiensis]|uniref:Sensor protein FixL n=1 Tax=Shewanella holmiensis TaxID=2952222 RepID=A0A9X2WNX0_9GAMM|nr:bifunctional diguanylate cyclase/phosphodiesterase [Shewanella holmiensis]MCT7942891.1 EAL domain-containing protein [Shewanella holmiensis]